MALTEIQLHCYNTYIIVTIWIVIRSCQVPEYDVLSQCPLACSAVSSDRRSVPCAMIGGSYWMHGEGGCHRIQGSCQDNDIVAAVVEVYCDVVVIYVNEKRRLITSIAIIRGGAHTVHPCIHLIYPSIHLMYPSIHLHPYTIYPSLLSINSVYSCLLSTYLLFIHPLIHPSVLMNEKFSRFKYYALLMHHPSIYLSIHLSIHPSIHSSIYPSIYSCLLSTYLLIHPFIHPFIHLSVLWNFLGSSITRCWCIHPSIHLSIHPSIYSCLLSTYLLIHASIHPSMHASLIDHHWLSLISYLFVNQYPTQRVCRFGRNI